MLKNDRIYVSAQGLFAIGILQARITVRPVMASTLRSADSFKSVRRRAIELMRRYKAVWTAPELLLKIAVSRKTEFVLST
jgi:hypothetical protein